MNFFTLTGIEITKIRRSKILLLLLFAAMLMWIPAIINSGSSYHLHRTSDTDRTQRARPLKNAIPACKQRPSLPFQIYCTPPAFGNSDAYGSRSLLYERLYCFPHTEL